MNYLSLMTDDEIKYVCSVIPLQASTWYFKQYPKDFAKIMPGFRPTSLKNQEQVGAVLFRSRRHHFISSFLEKSISRWLDEIQNEIILITDKGESKESAWLQTFPHCFFVDNIVVFFKLIGEEHSDELVSLLEQSIKHIKELNASGKKLEIVLNKKESENTRLEDDIKRIQNDLDKSRKQLDERIAETMTLQKENADLEKLDDIVRSHEREITILRGNVQERDEIIKNLQNELVAVKNEQQQLEEKIKDELNKQKITRLIEQASSAKPRCPKDINEFRDYLGYNFESIGIEPSADYYSLLMDYLCEVLFTGKPILVSRNTGMSLMKCVSNAIVSSPTVPTLIFTPDISTETIYEFLSAKNRIMCLDNFVGYFDEMILTTVCEKYKDKILFLTVAYDKVLRFISEDFLKYCHYINLNRIEIFADDRNLSEDPSIVDEVEALNPINATDVRWALLLRDILNEFDIGKGLSAYMSSRIADEESLIRLLAFNILPYCLDVLDIEPFVASERLNKYAGNNGRCSCKELFGRWFS